MKRQQIALLILLAAGSLAVGTAAQAQVAADVRIGPSGRAAVDIGFFSDDLAPYGRWVDRPTYGRVFVPRIRHAHWRPYTLGHWVETDYGWTWVSDEPFGWATYHYGRWASDPELGWYWVPGTDWGPAWVSWQEGGDYIGWAALPPSIGFDGSVGLELGGVDLSVAIAPDAYCFVPERRFLDPGIGGFIVAPARNVAIFRTTRNFTNYRFVNNRVFNQGVPTTRIQQVIGRPVPRLRVADLPANSRERARVQGNQVAFFRPAVNSPHGAHHIGMAAADVAAAHRTPAATGRVNSRQARQRSQPTRVQPPARVHQQRQARVQQQRQNRPPRPQAQVERRPPPAQPQANNQRQQRQTRAPSQPQARVQTQRQARPQPQARVQQQRQARPQPQARQRQGNPRPANPNDHRRPPDQGPPA